MKASHWIRLRLNAGFGSGCRATAAVYVTFGTGVARDLADVSVNDHCGFVVRLFIFLFRYLFSGFRFTFHLLSPIRLGGRKPIVQREHSKTCPESGRSFFFCNWSSTSQVHKSSELSTDLKIVEPSYTSAPHELKSRIAQETCFWTIKYGRW